MKDLTYKSKVLKEFEEKWAEATFADGTVDKHNILDFVSQALDGQMEELRELVFTDDPECEHGFLPAEDCTAVRCEIRFRRKLLTLIPNPSQHE